MQYTRGFRILVLIGACMAIAGGLAMLVCGMTDTDVPKWVVILFACGSAVSGFANLCTLRRQNQQSSRK